MVIWGYPQKSHSWKTIREIITRIDNRIGIYFERLLQYGLLCWVVSFDTQLVYSPGNIKLSFVRAATSLTHGC